jgi:nitroimidazol reductase NimA-like FMN-containing flavoprotein (pyridoxamine 5'-phosphate oxidase superfamily)
MTAAAQPDRRMRRAEREITDPAALEQVLAAARVLFLALRDEPAPYVIPVCFGLDAGTLYIHSALGGTKMDLLRAHPVVGFSACTDMTVIPGALACDFTSAARSVVGTGRARIVESDEERRRGLDSIMRHYTDAPAGPPAVEPVYRPATLSRTCVIAISIGTLRGKSTGELSAPLRGSSEGHAP